MIDVEWCLKCKREVYIEYKYEEVGDAESGPCVQVTDVVVECGHDINQDIERIDLHE